MDAAQLRATQAPIKERYKSDPKAAMITLTARGSIETKASPARSRPAARWRWPACTRQPAAPALNCAPATCLLEALAACAGVTLKSVATAIEVPLKSGKVTGRRRSRFPRHARRRQGGAGRLCRNPPALRRRYRCAAGQARSALENSPSAIAWSTRPSKMAEGFGDDATGVSQRAAKTSAPSP